MSGVTQHLRAARKEGVCSRCEHIVADVLEVTAVFVPGSGRGDVVGCAFALDFDEELHVICASGLPGREGRQELEAVGFGVDDDGFGGAIDRKSVV